MQLFEKYENLAQSILYAANNWKINKGWTTHLEEINNLCIRIEAKDKDIAESKEVIDHLNEVIVSRDKEIKELKNQLKEQEWVGIRAFCKHLIKKGADGEATINLYTSFKDEYK